MLTWIEYGFNPSKLGNFTKIGTSPSKKKGEITENVEFTKMASSRGDQLAILGPIAYPYCIFVGYLEG
jgi:hypothetical protein